MNSRKRVIILEDNLADTKLYEVVLDKYDTDLDISFYLNGAIFKNAFKDIDSLKEIDLLILDLNMPKINGLEVLQFIRQQLKLPNLPIIIFSSSEHQKDIESAYNLGADAYVVSSQIIG